MKTTGRPFLFLSLVSSLALSTSAQAKPKLAILLVIDQFRADYLYKYRDRFQPGGFRLLMENGAYFKNANTGHAPNLTAPGHAAMLTGAPPYLNGIIANYWWDPVAKRKVGAVEDSALGVSPHNLLTPTLGDSLKSATDGKSKVVSVSIKDRAAVLMGGLKADIAIWYSDTKSSWITSEYYTKENPEWFKKSSLRPRGELLDVALDAIDAYQLGRDENPDVLAISVSDHDIMGHKYGPGSKEMLEQTFKEDRLVAKFLEGLAKKVPGGFHDIEIVFTADHGVTNNESPTNPSSRINLENELNTLLGGKYVSKVLNSNIWFTPETKKSDGFNKMLDTALAYIRGKESIAAAYKLTDLLNGQIPPTLVAAKMAKSVTPLRSGDIVFATRAGATELYEEEGFAHGNPMAEDGTIPIIFFGAAFKPGVYFEEAILYNIAPTLAATLDVLPPGSSEGRVLNEIMRPVSPIAQERGLARVSTKPATHVRTGGNNFNALTLSKVESRK